MLADLHVAGAWIFVIGNGLAALWALAAHRFERVRHRALWWFTAAVQAWVSVEIVLGVVLQNRTDTEPGDFHVFYSVVAAMAVGVLFGYRQQLRDRLYLLYGLGGLFVMGLGIRAMTLTGTP